MQINVRFLDNLKVEASFDDYIIIADQPVRYKGDALAPSPFDYFLASSAMCAAYFVKVYCQAREIATEDIRIYQNNTVDPENRYHQNFIIDVQLPETINEKDRQGIIAAIERCTVKRVIQNNPEFTIQAQTILGQEQNIFEGINLERSTSIPGKDRNLEDTLKSMTAIMSRLGIRLEIASWRNPVPYVWSVHLRDADCPINYTNGKGSSREAALCSALGEFFERLSTHYFYADYYLGAGVSEDFVHYPNEQWFEIPKNNEVPTLLMDEYLKKVYSLDGELKANHLVDTNSGNVKRGICALPFTRYSDQEIVYIPVNLIGNLFVSNGMSAGNSQYEARVQCLSEIFERAVKNQIISEEIILPDVPESILKLYPKIHAGITKLQEEGFPVLVKDASLGGRYPVMNITLINPKTGGVYASFGAHPHFEIALERALTELLQGRSFEGLNDLPPPTFHQHAVADNNNLVEHFIDSSGVISWKFFSNQAQYEFVHWNFTGNTEEEFKYLIGILQSLEKEVYIADYNHLGVPACRILVPDFSEIYEIEDLIWDNNNQALKYRDDILNIHDLGHSKTQKLIHALNESELDDYMPIGELIGISFDDNSCWGRLVVLELKAMCYLKTENLESAQMSYEQLIQFNDNSSERVKLFKAINTMLTIKLDPDLDINHFHDNLIKVYGLDIYESAKKMVSGESPFLGLTKTNSHLQNLDKHQRLIESYYKSKCALSGKSLLT